MNTTYSLVFLSVKHKYMILSRSAATCTYWKFVFKPQPRKQKHTEAVFSHLWSNKQFLHSGLELVSTKEIIYLKMVNNVASREPLQPAKTSSLSL